MLTFLKVNLRSVIIVVFIVALQIGAFQLFPAHCNPWMQVFVIAKDSLFATTLVLLFYKYYESKRSRLQTQKSEAERIEYEQQLKQNEEKYRNLVEHSPDAIVVVKGHEWVYLNETAYKLFGIPEEGRSAGKSIFNFIHPDYHEAAIKGLEQGEVIDFVPQKMVRCDGQVIDVEVKAIPFAFFGESARHVIIRDMTERNETERFITLSEKLSMAGQLAAGLAHEIRNPLTSLKGFLQLLRSSDSIEKDVYFEIMSSELARIEGITTELLMLAKPQAKNMKEADLKLIIQQVVILLEAQANLYNIKIILEIPNEPILLKCNENEIKQVFINILKNGIEAMSHGGEISIGVRKQDMHALISITDQGKGMTKEQVEKLGQPFQSSKEGGTGLGMMICYRIVENYQGKIEVTSKVNEGTTFQIAFPLT